METIGWIILITISVVGIVLLYNAYSEDASVFSKTLLGTALYGIGSFIICGQLGLIKTSPNAMDVYRNKTTLEITYKDSIPVDSVVVWKDEFKK